MENQTTFEKVIKEETTPDQLPFEIYALETGIELPPAYNKQKSVERVKLEELMKQMEIAQSFVIKSSQQTYARSFCKLNLPEIKIKVIIIADNPKFARVFRLA